MLYSACAWLDGGPTDRDHHNTVLMLDGYLWMPWAHEAGYGGITVFDVSDPCAPVTIGSGTDPDMRETHAAGIAFLQGRRWMVVTDLEGIQFWDVTDPRAPERVSRMVLPGVHYPNSYARVVMSVFWQAPLVFVGAADNGVFVVDASDPNDPRLLSQFRPEPVFRVGGVHAIGTLLVVFGTEGSRHQFFDISVPESPRPLPGGSWVTEFSDETLGGRRIPMPAYFSHINGHYTYHARHVLGGGLIVFDVSDPSAPRFAGHYRSMEEGANGGYVFIKDQRAFVGLSGHAQILDVSDPSSISVVATLRMQGDFDMLVPIGNVAVGSVDDDAEPDRASAVFPVETEPDALGPVVNRVEPPDGAEGVALTARIGLTFSEFVELHSVRGDALIVRPVGSDAPIAGHVSGQEGVVNFAPVAPLTPDTEYEVVLRSGGVTDVSGNGLREAFRSTFRTESCGGR